MGTALTVLGVIAALVVGAVVFVMLLIPFFKGVGWLFSRIFRFIASEITDVFRLIGAFLTAIVYVFLIVGSVLIARWSAASHFGRAFQSELATVGGCIYRVILGNLLRLLGLTGLTEGFERRMPEVIRAAPGSDSPSPRTGQFEGYKIVGSLAGGGSGAKLYIAVPDSVKAAAFVREGLHDVTQVVIKSFSLSEGSSLPQIVRESRSLDAAKRMGLILDHELSPHRFYYVMRYVPGESLSIVTRRLHAASPSDGLAEPQLRLAIGYACDLLATLSEYHRGGLWHKDVKPDNIIVDGGPNPRAHLVDFGLVSSLRSAMTLTTHGTEYFRDPELVRQALKGVKVHEVDGTRFDIYAAGAVLYSVLEDSFPAHGVLSQVSKRCPDSIKWIIRRAMTDYDKRYTSADMMLADLRTVVRAVDPFEVRPVQLPSMSGEAEVAAPVAQPQPVAVAASGSPVPPSDQPNSPAAGFGPAMGAAGLGAAGVGGAGLGAAGAVPAGAAGAAIPGFGAAAAGLGGAAFDAGRRTAPKIRMVNWWSGKAEADPGHPLHANPSSPAELRDMARDAIGQVWANVQGKGRRPQPEAGPARPWVPPTGPRKAAREQLASARARMEAARERARQRVDGRTGNFSPSGMGGVIGAVVVFLAIFAVIIGSLLSNNSNHEVAVELPAPPTGIFVNGVEALAEDFVPAESMPPQKDPVHLLVINDVRRPWSPAMNDAITGLMASIDLANIQTIGDDLTPSDDAGEVDTTAKARMVLDGEQIPVDSREAPARFQQWLGARKAPDLDAVLWIAPPVADTELEPRLFLFSNKSVADSPRVRAVLQALEPLAGGSNPANLN